MDEILQYDHKKTDILDNNERDPINEKQMTKVFPKPKLSFFEHRRIHVINEEINKLWWCI